MHTIFFSFIQVGRVILPTHFLLNIIIFSLSFFFLFIKLTNLFIFVITKLISFIFFTFDWDPEFQS